MNIPTLTQSEEERAPWNDDEVPVEVTISQTLSRTAIVYISKKDEISLEDAVLEQIILPNDALSYCNEDGWTIDDFCVL